MQTVVQHKYHRQVFKDPLVLVVIRTTARCSRSHWYGWSSLPPPGVQGPTGAGGHPDHCQVFKVLLVLVVILSQTNTYTFHWLFLACTHSSREIENYMWTTSQQWWRHKFTLWVWVWANVFTNLVNTNQGNDTNAVQSTNNISGVGIAQ